MRKAFIVLIIFITSLFITSCIKADINGNSGVLSITDINTEFDTNTLSETINWNTQESASSKFYFGTSDTTLDSVIETSSGTKNRNLNITGLLPETTYFYKIESEINSYYTVSEIYSFTTPAIGGSGGGSTIKSITGSFDYVQTNQDTGFYILELWEESSSFTGDPVERRFYRTSSDSFDIKLDTTDSYIIRIFRDYDSDTSYTEKTDAVVTSSTIDLSTSSQDIGNLTLLEPAQVIETIAITGADSFPGPTIDNTVPKLDISTIFFGWAFVYIIVTSYDQWGNIYGEATDTVTLSWVGSSDVSIFSPSAPIQEDLTGGQTAEVTLWLILDVPLSGPGWRGGQIYAELDSDTSINDYIDGNIRLWE
jgi:hypothetical protein